MVNPFQLLDWPASGPCPVYRRPRHGSGSSRTGHAMQSGRQQGQQTGCVVARGAVHDDPPPGRARAEGEGEMTRWLNFGTAAFAFAAAVFWFLSASGKLPELQAYWDKTPADDPFYTALIASAKMNRIAALFSGLSALCAGVNALRQRA